MADKPPAPVEDVAKDVLPTGQPKPAGNPVFRMMGEIACKLLRAQDL